MAILCYVMYKETGKGRRLYLPMHMRMLWLATIYTALRKKHYPLYRLLGYAPSNYE